LIKDLISLRVLTVCIVHEFGKKKVKIIVCEFEYMNMCIFRCEFRR